MECVWQILSSQGLSCLHLYSQYKRITEHGEIVKSESCRVGAMWRLKDIFIHFECTRRQQVRGEEHQEMLWGNQPGWANKAVRRVLKNIFFHIKLD